MYSCHAVSQTYHAPGVVATAQVYVLKHPSTVLIANPPHNSQSAHNIFDAFANTKVCSSKNSSLRRQSSHSPYFFKLSGAIRPASAAVVDIYIATWLCYHLHDSKTGHSQYVDFRCSVHVHKSRAHDKRHCTRSDNMVTKLVNYAFTRGMLTS